MSESTPSSESPSPEDTPERLASAGPYPTAAGALDRALALVRYLREHCPWDRRQTARSLIPHLIEETHETVEAIQAGDPDALSGELGDLLLNLAFQIVVAEEEGAFDAERVVHGLERKMIRRHPHLFGLGEKASWEAIKARERAEAQEEEHAPDGSARHGWKGLDPLLRAHRIQEKAAGVGFDWDEASGAMEKVREELGEVVEAMDSGRRASLHEEMGDLLFAVVNLARLAGTPAVPALMDANQKFERRFHALEARALARGVPIPGATLEEMDRLWDEVKEEEK